MGKHYTTSFKLQVIQTVLENKMGVREAAQFFAMPNHTVVVVWLQRFKKCGINGLIRQPNQNRTATMRKPKIDGAKKVKDTNDINALLARIEYLEAENACLKKLKEIEEREARLRKEKPLTR